MTVSEQTDFEIISKEYPHYFGVDIGMFLEMALLKKISQLDVDWDYLGTSECLFFFFKKEEDAVVARLLS